VEEYDDRYTPFAIVVLYTSCNNSCTQHIYPHQQKFWIRIFHTDFDKLWHGSRKAL